MIADVFGLLVSRWNFFAGLLLEHVQISLASIIIAVVIGGAAGILISEFTCASKPTLAVINFLYTIPSISMLGFLIPFSGVGNATAVIALTVYALLPMVRNTYTGMTNLSPAILEAAKGMGSTRWQILYKIKLPLATPVITSGIRSMVTMTIALAGIASFIGAGGLGVAIYRGITTNNAAMTMAGSLLIAVLALVLDFIPGAVERRMDRRFVRAKRTGRVTGAVVALACAALVLVPFFTGHSADTIHIATKPMTEQYIMGEALDILIEQDTDLTVELTQGVGGGTSNIQPAMESGEFDIYPEYTGTGWNLVLMEESVYDESLFPTLAERYAADYDMSWLGMYGFNNTYGLVVRSEIARQYGLETYSDLAAIAPQLTFGAEYDFFEREDGYDALCETYGLVFGATMDLDIGLKYQALAQGEIDVMVIFTTDGQLSAADAVVLADDKGFFPSYLCGNVVRNEVLAAHPELYAVFDKLAGTIHDEDMAAMNYAVETEGAEPRDVAMDLLVERGLLNKEAK
nr:glycine betaine ABC transporter substrate-binding protein [uncultured Agathobaculum sp.]